ncbi:MAG: orotidine-5'-phosphate decarboxylase [Verrucomicrobia bacterium]|nr:MAG: orotidine-5'-phosphate decarboxylase [Verrucomicrobiota bacterium]
MPTDLILVLDLPDRTETERLLDRIGSSVAWVKIGLQLFTRYGPSIVEDIARRGYKVFLDLKLHDIPNTVARAVESLNELPISMLTIHTTGGSEMMRWALKAQEGGNPDLLLLGVTVLTSTDRNGLEETGVAAAPVDQVLRLARLAIDAGMKGLVCSPLELSILRARLGPGIALVTPGIRPVGADLNEQKRVMTPVDAMRAGASHIVVGRPILRAADPAEAATAIQAELGNCP